jgi:hypothetical protein
VYELLVRVSRDGPNSSRRPVPSPAWKKGADTEEAGQTRAQRLFTEKIWWSWSMSEVSYKRLESQEPASEAEKKGATSGCCPPVISYGNACGWSGRRVLHRRASSARLEPSETPDFGMNGPTRPS